MRNSKKMRETPGEFVRYCRETMGKTQVEMAEKFGVSRVTWQTYEYRGAPRWMRYALMGYAMLHADMIPPYAQVPAKELSTAGRLAGVRAETGDKANECSAI